MTSYLKSVCLDQLQNCTLLAQYLKNERLKTHVGNASFTARLCSKSVT